MDMKLEVVVVPVTDVDRAKQFYTLRAVGSEAPLVGLVRRLHRRPATGQKSGRGVPRRISCARSDPTLRTDYDVTGAVSR